MPACVMIVLLFSKLLLVSWWAHTRPGSKTDTVQQSCAHKTKLSIPSTYHMMMGQSLSSCRLSKPCSNPTWHCKIQYALPNKGTAVQASITRVYVVLMLKGTVEMLLERSSFDGNGVGHYLWLWVALVRL